MHFYVLLVSWYKRLEEHRCKWPKLYDQILTINRKQLSWLLTGLDFSHAHQRLYYLHAG
jgi:hypothetical protein